MPYGAALPSPRLMKSYTLTMVFFPFGCHSLPLFLKLPMSSFFLQSTEIIGSVALSGAACPGRSGTPALTLPRISSMTTARAFRGFRFPAEVILWAVRWYLQFPISYRDLEAMLADRGVAVDHTTMYRWVQRFAPELGSGC